MRKVIVLFVLAGVLPTVIVVSKAASAPTPTRLPPPPLGQGAAGRFGP